VDDAAPDPGEQRHDDAGGARGPAAGETAEIGRVLPAAGASA
jgi:hypothetical protein